LSASGLAQINTDISKVIAQAEAAYDRADYVEAVRWYRLAADQGNATAQFNLGVMSAKGEGAPKNFVEAYKWLTIAAARGYSDAAKSRDTVRAGMTTAQIAEGQRLAAAWRPK